MNTVAAAAGVDKQLIYYHFGGLDGVIRHLGGQLELWLGTPLEPRPGEPYGEAVCRLLMEYARALRHNPLVLRLLAWELVEPTDVLKELEVARSGAMAGWVQGLRAAAQAVPAGIDAPAVNAVLLAGLHYLALREQTLGSFAGMDISTPEGAARIVAQTIGLLRWVLVVPALAAAHADPHSSAATHDAVAVVFDAVHRYGGMVIGEMTGQLLLAAWTGLVALQLWRTRAVPRVLSALGLLTLPLWLLGQTELLHMVVPAVPALEVIPLAFMAWEAWLAAMAVSLLVSAWRGRRTHPPGGVAIIPSTAGMR